MVRNIVKDVIFLKQKSLPATKLDISIAKDLQDTLLAHKDSCVGMAANMIGYTKRIIIVNAGFINILMFNPKIIKKSEAYEAEESCLSLFGVRKTRRYKHIEVEYEDISFNKQKRFFSGFTAQIIQHELDHCDGIII